MSIKNYNLKDWITGYTLGLAGKPLPISVTKKEPVAYLYGHVAKEGETTPLVWVNYDLLSEDGTIYLQASDPIPVSTAEPIDPTSLLMGYRVGQMVRNLRRSANGERMLIGSTYNGVPLPALPDWGGVYSYFLIRAVPAPIDGGVNFDLYAYSEKPVVSPDGDSIGMESKAQYMSTFCDYWDTLDWYKPYKEPINGTGTVSIDGIIWSNFDIHLPDDTLLLNGSDPVSHYQRVQMHPYNGIILPRLPIYDTKAYPFVLIMTQGNNVGAPYRAFVATEKPFYPSSGNFLSVGTSNGGAMEFFSNESCTAWGRMFEHATVIDQKKIVWANFDVHDADGTLLVPASPYVPIATDYPENRPSAYLYNGMKLPKLPEWDKDMYPYVAVQGRAGNQKVLHNMYVSKEPLNVIRIDNSYPDGYVLYLSGLEGLPNWRYRLPDIPDWAAGEPFKYNEQSVYNSRFDRWDDVWTNHDIMYGNTRKFQAMAAIPVYE